MRDLTVAAPRRYALAVLALALALAFAPGRATAATISFSTFVSQSNISAAENGQTNTIGFTFAGNEFVGSLYLGSNNFQLYSTNTSGGNVQKFGTPMTGSPGETVLAASLGLGGFPQGNIYASPANNLIYHYANSGGSPTLFATIPSSAGVVRQIFFDPGSSFGGNMLVTTTSGNIYRVTSAGAVSLLASTGEDTEGMDIATSAWGSFAGQLMVASEGSGKLRLIAPNGTVSTLGTIPGSEFETVSFVPLDLNTSTALQGFYVADYPVDIQFASASQFVNQNLLGDAIVTSEFSSSAAVWDVHYNGGSSFTITQFSGHLPFQSEDGIFVTQQRLADLGPAAAVPEPSSLALMAVGVGALGWRWLRRKRGS